MQTDDIQIVDTKILTLKDISITKYRSAKSTSFTEFTWFFQNDKTKKRFTRKTLTGKNLPRYKKDNHITLIRSLAEYTYGKNYDFSTLEISDLINNKVIETIKITNHKYFSTFSPVRKSSISYRKEPK